MGAISGMPVAETYSGPDGYTMVQFEKTPIMSTYLLAFLVSDFVFTENQEDPDLYKVSHYVAHRRLANGEAGRVFTVPSLRIHRV